MFLGVPLWIWAIVCLLLAGLYTVKWPRPTSAYRPPWVNVVMRWFHALVWVLMAAAALLSWIGNGAGSVWSLRLAVILYAVFFVTTIYDRQLAQRGE